MQTVLTRFEQEASGNSQNGFDVFDYGIRSGRSQPDDGSLGKLTFHHVQKFVVWPDNIRENKT